MGCRWALWHGNTSEVENEKRIPVSPGPLILLRSMQWQWDGVTTSYYNRFRKSFAFIHSGVNFRNYCQNSSKAIWDNCQPVIFPLYASSTEGDLLEKVRRFSYLHL